MGLITAPPVKEHEEPCLEINSLPEEAKLDSSLSFMISLADGVVVNWRCKMRDNVLIVDIPINLPMYGSKDSFLTLLEYAETGLKVGRVIITLDKNRPDLADLMRLFMFFGFSPINPAVVGVISPALTSVPLTDGLIYLVYEAN